MRQEEIDPLSPFQWLWISCPRGFTACVQPPACRAALGVLLVALILWQFELWFGLFAMGGGQEAGKGE
jgi:hypothetical protein